jgi:hypothetical protein
MGQWQREFRCIIEGSARKTFRRSPVTLYQHPRDAAPNRAVQASAIGVCKEATPSLRTATVQQEQKGPQGLIFMGSNEDPARSSSQYRRHHDALPHVCAVCTGSDAQAH